MKYFIGAPIPKAYKNKIELLRAEFRFFSTEPHITLVPPPALPDDDGFVKDIIKICKDTKKIKVALQNIGQFGSRVLYVSVSSPQLIRLHEKIYEELNIKEEERGYTPHLTVVKQRPGRKVDIPEIKDRAEARLAPYPEFFLNSIVIYHQPREKSIYVPYMEIPLDGDYLLNK